MKWLICILALFAGALSLRADTIAQWNFNSVPSDAQTSTGTNVPSVGTGSASLLNDVTGSFSNGSTNDPATGTDDSGWNTSHYPPQGTSNKTAGVQFNLSTVGYSNIVVRWDQRTTGTASRYFRLQYSSDGVNFIDYPTPVVAQVAATGSTEYEAQTNSLAAIASVNDNPNFAFRIVAEWESSAAGSGTNGYAVLGSSYSTAGTVRFDYVTISGTPLPGGNTPPYIFSSFNNQFVRVNHSTAPQPFTVLDAEDPAINLTVSATSSDTSVIPPGNVTFGGSSSSRTVAVAAGAQPGSSIITVWVSDTGAKSNSAAFTVTVLPANTAPSISVIPATNTLVSTAISPISFTIGDAETASANLNISGVSASPGLVPDGSIVFGGSGGNRTVAVTPAAAEIGVAPITVTVSDGTNSASSIFGVMVRPAPDVIFYDPFSYPDGSILTNSGFLWENNTGTLGECQTINGQLQVTGDQTEDVEGRLAAGPYNKNLGTVLYASFKANFQSLPKVTPDYFAAFIGGSSQVGRVYASSATNAPPGTFRLAVANGSSTNTPLAIDLDTNTTHTIVTRYQIDTATSTLWLNPSAETDPSVTASDIKDPINISSFGFRQGAGLGATILVDDLKVGLSFASVTSTNSVSLTPIRLNLSRLGNNVVLTWTNAAFSLQGAPSLASPFTNIPSASSPYTNPATGSARFFRLRAN